ncbi:hypothetical protein [Neobacillus ginsengisoli]|uniref:Uncharacterized protein n=1 Tax=Neobacillus ginsengisoli TaxID=904295 RepID=A0ABT9XX53_9BACI|nr:hypothetical protein [Neobacillus ginsengisoli]MDQ0200151.1 hypothetical protein [Neobacillus ginsengisoli]
MINLNLPMITITYNQTGVFNAGKNVNLIKVKTASIETSPYNVPLGLPLELQK